MIRYILAILYYIFIIFNYFSPESRLVDLFDPRSYHFAVEHWMLELRFIGYTVITFLLFISMILLLARNLQYRKIGLISIISVPLFYILIVVSATLYFEIPIEKMINIYAGNNDSIVGMNLYLGESDLLAIGIIMLGFPLIYSKTLYDWVYRNQWGSK
jgi:hypothetical protein